MADSLYTELPELPGFTRLPDPPHGTIKYNRRVQCNECGTILHPNGTGNHRGSKNCRARSRAWKRPVVGNTP